MGITSRLTAGVRGAGRRLTGRAAPWEPAPTPPPPPLPPGWRTGPPTWVGIGAQKAGTTWWARLLRRHPGSAAVPGLPKELHYFDAFAFRSWSPAAAAGYHRYFPRPEVGPQVTGEWTPSYLARHWVPALLAEAAPDARLLVLLRDPVERYRSGLTHFLRRGHGDDPRLAALSFAIGCYASQLAWWERHVPRARILVLQYERCCAEPAAELARTYAFVGLDPSFRPERLDAPANRTAGEKLALDPHQRAELVAAYEPEVDALVRAWPEIDPALWPGFAHLGRPA